MDYLSRGLVGEAMKLALATLTFAFLIGCPSKPPTTWTAPVALAYPNAVQVGGFWCDESAAVGQCEAIAAGVAREKALFASHGAPLPVDDSWINFTVIIFKPTQCRLADTGSPKFYPGGSGPDPCNPVLACAGCTVIPLPGSGDSINRISIVAERPDADGLIAHEVGHLFLYLTGRNYFLEGHCGPDDPCP
jgi:hypothetical protein